MKITKYFSYGMMFVLSFALSATPLFAQTNTSTTNSAKVNAEASKINSINQLKAQVDKTLDAKANASLQTKAEVKSGTEIKANAELKTTAEVKAQSALELQKRKEAASLELTQKKEELRQEVEKKKIELQKIKEEAKVEGAEKKEEMKKTAEEIRSERREEVKKIIFANFTKVAENLSQISERINSRISKMKEAGSDVTVAEKLMINAESSLTAAISFSQDVKVKLESDTSVENVRETAEFARTAFRNSHKYLVETVNLLKTNLEKEREVKVNSITDVTVTGEAKE